MQLDVLILASSAPAVIARRLAKAGRDWREPGFVEDPEWRRMVQEKAAAAVEAAGPVARWWLDGFDHPFDPRRGVAVWRGALRPYARRVANNARRLGG